MTRLASILCIFFVTHASLAAISQQEVSRLKRELSSQSNQIFKISGSIQSLEEELGQKNNIYLLQVEKIARVEESLEKLKTILDKQKQEIANEESKLKKLAEKLILEKSDDSSDDSLLKQKLFVTALLDNQKSLEESLTKTLELEKDVEAYQVRLEEHKKVETDIYQIVIELEQKKKNLSEEYLKKVSVKNDLESKLDNMVATLKVSKPKAKSKLSSNVSLDLLLPLRKFTGYKVSEKGVNFKFKDVLPVNATETGNVVYAGDLATYGKVVIIDHGNDIRSVFLGDITTKVQKGDRVQKGDLIGYTNTNRGVEKNLYYELRKKNIAQNTFQWLEKNNLQAFKM